MRFFAVSRLWLPRIAAATLALVVVLLVILETCDPRTRQMQMIRDVMQQAAL